MRRKLLPAWFLITGLGMTGLGVEATVNKRPPIETCEAGVIGGPICVCVCVGPIECVRICLPQ